MKVLHIYNPANIAGTLAKFLRKLGVEAEVICSEKNHHAGYENEVIPDDKFVEEINKRVPNADIIHIHFFWEYFWYVKNRWPIKPIVFHLHGTDIRSNSNNPRMVSAEKTADALFYSTKDLKQFCIPSAKWLPNPIDTDMFKPIKEINKEKRMLYFYKFSEPLAPQERIKELLRKHEYFMYLDTFDCTTKWIAYESMPTMLNRYQYFLDDVNYTTFSAAAHQALLCGATVVKLNYVSGELKEFKKFSDSHRAENVVDNLMEVYNGLIH